METSAYRFATLVLQSCEVAHACSRLKKVSLFNEQKEFFSWSIHDFAVIIIFASKSKYLTKWVKSESGSGRCYAINNDLNQVWKTKGYHLKIFEKKSQYVFMNLKPLSQDIDIQLNA